MAGLTSDKMAGTLLAEHVSPRFVQTNLVRICQFTAACAHTVWGFGKLRHTTESLGMVVRELSGAFCIKKNGRVCMT